MMTLADFGTLLSDVYMNDSVGFIPVSTKSKSWQEMEKDRHVEHQEDVQQRYFYSNQPKSTANKYHQYPTRSKTSTNEAKTTIKDKEFVFLRDKGEKVTHVFKQFEFILRDDFW